MWMAVCKAQHSGAALLTLGAADLSTNLSAAFRWLQAYNELKDKLFIQYKAATPTENASILYSKGCYASVPALNTIYL